MFEMDDGSEKLAQAHANSNYVEPLRDVLLGQNRSCLLTQLHTLLPTGSTMKRACR